MIPIIENEKEFAGTILKNCIAALRVWNDDQQCNITYYYRKTFQKGEKIEDEEDIRIQEKFWKIFTSRFEGAGV